MGIDRISEFAFIQHEPRPAIFPINSREHSLRRSHIDRTHKEALAKSAIAKYPTWKEKISTNSFVRLPLISFDCTVSFYVNDTSYTLHSSVYDLRTDPLHLEIPVRKGDKKLDAMEERLRAKDPLYFKCRMTATGKQEQINTLKITQKQIQDLGMADKLLGPANEAYVSREQLTDMGESVVSSLKIEETYEMSGDDFSQEFISKILDYTHSSFQPIPFDEALKSISKYELQYDGKDLSPDEIKKEMSSVMEINSYQGKEHIVLTKEAAERLAKQTETGMHNQGKLGWGMFSLGLTIDYTNKKSSDWAKYGLNIDDQFRELNEYSSSSVQWERDGNRIIPKTLNLAKVTRASLNNQFDFSRIKKRITDAKYYRTPEISIDNAEQGPQSSVEESIQMMKNAIAENTKKIAENTKKISALQDVEIKKLWDTINGIRPWTEGEFKKLWDNVNGIHPWAEGEVKKLWDNVNGIRPWTQGEFKKVWDWINGYHDYDAQVKMLWDNVCHRTQSC